MGLLNQMVKKRNSKFTGGKQSNFARTGRESISDTNNAVAERPLSPSVSTTCRDNSSAMEARRYSRIGNEIKRSVICAAITLAALGVCYLIFR